MPKGDQPTDHVFTVTVFDDVDKPASGTVRTMPWSEFVERFNHQTSEKREGRCISPVTYRGNYRNQANALTRHGLAGDFEQAEREDKKTGEVITAGPPPVPPAVAVQRLAEHGYAAVVATTFKHTPAKPRFRIILLCKGPIDYPADPDERANTFQAEAEGQKLFYESVGLGDGLDLSKLKPDATYYTPRCPDLAIAERYVVAGAPLDFAQWLEKGRAVVQHRLAEQAEAARCAAEAAEERRQRNRADGHDISLLEDVRDALPTFERALPDAGYTYFPRLRRWLYPGSSSGMPGVSILTGRDGVERYVSHHASDPLRIDTEVFGARAHDIVDFVIHQRFGENADSRQSLRQIAIELGVMARRDADRKRAMQIMPANDLPKEPKDEWNDDVEAEDVDAFLDPQASDAQQAARRAEQVAQNVEIGEGEPVDTRVDILTLEEAIDRFVFQTDGSRVADRLNPRIETALSDFRNMTAASTMTILVKKRIFGIEHEVEKVVPVANMWLANSRRVTVVTRTFRPSASEFTTDPGGLKAFNTWRPRSSNVDVDPKLANPFLEHVHFVFGTEAEFFLDWLAHIEQQPGVLAHTAWLNIATRTGLGRNWISSVLARLWRGNVAANVDLVGLIESGFNGNLSNKLLAVVDEIREGGSGSAESWRFSERLKSIITEESRLINPKYGRQSVEWNSCRWLLFSNHRSALKLTDSDRRFNLSICDAAPRSPTYYANLYGQLRRPGFIDAVAALLRTRDLSRFNPGDRAILNAARDEVVALSKNEAQTTAESIVRHWPCDLITMPQFRDIMEDHASDRRLAPATRYAMEDAGIRKIDRKVQIQDARFRVMSVRNHARWERTRPGDLATEIESRLPAELLKLDKDDAGDGWNPGHWRQFLDDRIDDTER